MKRQLIVTGQTKEPITIPHPEKLPEFEPLIDPNTPKIYPDESPIENPPTGPIENPPYELPKPSEFSIK